MKDQPKFYIICKIRNWELFNEYFPLINNRKVQPSWEFFEQKGTIKIPLDDIYFDETISYNDFLEITDLDIPFFKSFSDIFIYIEYNKFINVYEENTYIDVFDFKFHKTKIYKRYCNLIKATVNFEKNNLVITNYFKKFLNNMYNVTLETMLLFHTSDFNIKNETLTVQMEHTSNLHEQI